MRIRSPPLLLIVIFLIIFPIIKAEENLTPNFESNTTVKVIIEFKDTPTIQTAEAEIQQKDKKTIKEKKLNKLKDETKKERKKNIDRLKKGIGKTNRTLKINKEFILSNAVTAEIDQATYEKLKNDSNIKSIIYDIPVSISLDSAVPVINGKNTSRLQYNGQNLTGKGFTACVIDTGVNYNHVNLGSGWGNKVIGGYDYVNNDADPMDDHGHGSHVSGIIISNHSTYKGIAPGAKIIHHKALNNVGSGSFSNVKLAVESCISQAAQYNITVITMSLGTSDLYNEYCDNLWPEFTDTVNLAIRNNIMILVASGNGGSKTGIAFPACITNVTAVGNSQDNDIFSSSSNRNKLLDLVAPGTSIISTIHTNNDFGTKSGTSMATPLVAGTALLLYQSYYQNSGQLPKPLDLQNILNRTGKQIDDTANSGLYYRRIDSYATSLAIDTFKPRITQIMPGYNSTYSNYNFFKISANEILKTVKIEYDSLNHSMIKDGIYYAYNHTSLGYGLNEYKIFSIDLANNTNITLIKITNNQQLPPNISRITYSKANNSLYSKELIWINFTISDPDGIKQTILRIDSNLITLNNVSSKYYAQVSLKAGIHIVNISSIDGLDNINNKIENYVINKTGQNLLIDSLNNYSYKTNAWIKCNNTIINNNLQLYINGNSIVNPYNINLTKVGSYNISCIANENENYSSKFISKIINVTKLKPLLYLKLNNLESDLTIEENNNFTILIYNNAGLNTLLYINGINEKEGSRINISRRYSIGTYNISAIINSNENITEKFKSYKVTVNAVSTPTPSPTATPEPTITPTPTPSPTPTPEPTITPTPTPIINPTHLIAKEGDFIKHNYTTNISLNFNYTIPNLDQCHYIIQKIMKRVTCTQAYINLSEGDHNITLITNDTSKNIRIINYTISIDATKPIVNFTNTSIPPNYLSSANQVKINISVNEPHLDKCIISYGAHIHFNGGGHGWSTTGIMNYTPGFCVKTIYTDPEYNYSYSITINDTYGNKITTENRNFYQLPENKDLDNDGVNNTKDFVIGTVNNITTNVLVTLRINGSTNLSRIIEGVKRVNITQSGRTIISFEFNFTNTSKLNLENVFINLTNTTKGGIAVNGINLSGNERKTVTIQDISNSLTGICIKDSENAKISSISSNCGASDEIYLDCTSAGYSASKNGNTYTCKDKGTIIEITGLAHSALTEYGSCVDSDGDGYGTGCAKGTDCNDNSASIHTGCSTSSTNTGSGGSSGGITPARTPTPTPCITDWECSEWSPCIEGKQTRTCSKTNTNCAISESPLLLQTCENERDINNNSQDSNNINNINQNINLETPAEIQNDDANAELLGKSTEELNNLEKKDNKMESGIITSNYSVFSIGNILIGISIILLVALAIAYPLLKSHYDRKKHETNKMIKNIESELNYEERVEKHKNHPE